MASVLETTAVSLRKGSTSANLAFTGVVGEVSADLGYGTDSAQGTDVHATLRLHNGITPGGIPMARADMRNITTAVLAENRLILGDNNLAYADLHNIEEIPEDNVVGRKKVENTLIQYNMINKTILDTTLEDYALKNMHNVDTTNLATSTGHQGANLAYADTTNINTGDLTDTTKHPTSSTSNRPLAYADMANVDTTNLATGAGTAGKHSGKNLAYSDMTNVTKTDIVDKGVEDASNKFTGTIGVDSYTSDSYPNVASIKNYVDTSVDPLLDKHLTLLPGMSAVDMAAASNANWRINAGDQIPSLNEEIDVDSKYNHTITTVKMVHDFLNTVAIDLAGACVKPFVLIDNSTVSTTGVVPLQTYVADYKVPAGVTLNSITFDTSNIIDQIYPTYYKYSYTDPQTSAVSYLYLTTPTPHEGDFVYDTNLDVIEDNGVASVDPDYPDRFLDINEHLYIYMNDSAQNRKKIAMISAFNIYIPSTANCSAVTWPLNVVWLDGNTPPLSTGQNYLIKFHSYDGGQTWVGIAEGWSTALWA